MKRLVNSYYSYTWNLWRHFHQLDISKTIIINPSIEIDSDLSIFILGGQTIIWILVAVVVVLCFTIFLALFFVCFQKKRKWKQSQSFGRWQYAPEVHAIYTPRRLTSVMWQKNVLGLWERRLLGSHHHRLWDG